MTNQVNEVLDKIRDVCDLKRLEFGCEVEQIRTGARGLLVGTPENENGFGYWFNHDGTIYPLLEEHIKIIGLPVQLNHLLWALWKADYVTFVSLTNEGAIDVMLGSGEDAETFHEVYYITKSVEDNLRSNPELTKWVRGVIIGKE